MMFLTARRYLNQRLGAVVGACEGFAVPICENLCGRRTMSVNQVAGNSPVQKVISKPVMKSVSAEAPIAADGARADKVELSGVSHLLDTLRTNEIRADKVQSVRAQIEAGTYETDDKLNVAADRLLDDLNDRP